MSHPFTQVDVFGAGPLLGNPVAVVHDADGLSTERMQRLARWLDLSETVFLLPPTSPGADYRVRIFTPAEELPFAGHPTLGACHAWREAGGVPRDPDRVVQECGAGAVELRTVGDRTAFAGPALVRDEEVDAADRASLAALLGVVPSDLVAARWVDNGPGWVAVRLASAAAVLAVDVDLGRDPRDGPRYLGLVGDAPVDADHDLEVRALFPDGSGSLREDPATGSLAAAVGRWLADVGELDDRFGGAVRLRQGTRLGREAHLDVRHDASDRIWVAGTTVTHVTGHLRG